MAQWKTTVDLHEQWLGRIAEDGKLVDWDNKHVSELASIVAEKLRAKFPEQLDPDNSKFDPELEDVVYYFDTVDDYDSWFAAMNHFPQGSAMRRMEEDYPPSEQFNSAMTCLYDWADKNLVWIRTAF
nr:MAG TPA: hypothetical protein [Caudoviricetes sp.]